MKSTLLLFLAFGFALGAQPGLYSNHTCYRSFDNFIINGEEAEDGAFPYMASLNTVVDSFHVCGLSLLTKNWALTAGHCCEALKRAKLFVYAGTNSVSKGGVHREIESYKIHEKYRPSERWQYDACVIKTKEPFELGPKIQTIALPRSGYDLEGGELVNVTGWGYTHPDDTSSAPDRLQLGKDFVVLSKEKCKELTSMSHESYLCVLGGKRGQGVCNGDSGSPLVKDGVQVGIASWVFLPCGWGKPDFFVRVPQIVDWIVETLGPDAEDLKFGPQTKPLDILFGRGRRA